MARKLIVGNWKMYGWRDSWRDLTLQIVTGARTVNADLTVCPPFPGLADVGGILSDHGGMVALGAQDVHPAAEGAYTGDVSVRMLKDARCKYVIVGHSERRAGHNEGDAQVAAKVASAMKGGLKPILCVGEVERASAAQAIKFIREQLKASLKGVAVKRGSDLVVAYEPVWAIGSGKTPTPNDVAETMSALRAMLADMYDPLTAKKVKLLYGGSVKPDNAAEMLSLKVVDGALVGGASLKAQSFLAIARCLQKGA